jgi:hypothetical protein
VTVDYPKSHQVIMPIAAALPNVYLLLEQINTFPCTCYVGIDLNKYFFSIPINKGYQKTFVPN